VATLFSAHPRRHIRIFLMTLNRNDGVEPREDGSPQSVAVSVGCVGEAISDAAPAAPST